MRLIDRDMLTQGKICGSVIVRSFQEYKDLGGKRDMLDAYAFIKERAKRFESAYIDLIDQVLSDIPVPEKAIEENWLLSQVHWYIIHLWFNKPLRKVDWHTFNLEEFNRL